jgi:hypothetical protein
MIHIKLMFALVALVLGAFAISAQEKLPEFGDMADLNGMTGPPILAPNGRAWRLLKVGSLIVLLISPGLHSKTNCAG